MSKQVIGINRKNEWNFSDNSTGEKRSGVNQLVYCIEDETLKGKDSEGYACEVLKAPADMDLSGLKVGKSYFFSLNTRFKPHTILDYHAV